MRPERARETFVTSWRRIRHLESATQLLEWDQETYMPPAAAPGRGAVLATLAGLRHDQITDPRLAEITEAVVDGAEPGSEWAAQGRESRRLIARAARIPRRLAEETAAAASLALEAWQVARRELRWEGFAPSLDRVLELKREEAACLHAEHPYDGLLDLFEPGATESGLTPLFAELRQKLVPLVQAVASSGRAVDERAAQGSFPLGLQKELGWWVAQQIGFDWTAGRLDTTTHPFCQAMGRRDVRLTWRGSEGDLRPAFFAILHEMGHGLYEQGLPQAWEGTPLGASASTGIHESQSRLWENLVGRSRPFWRWLLPVARERFPSLSGDLDAFWPTLRVVRPSLIRVEADEVTYNLHIVIRFELERALFAGDLGIDELPAAWDRAYEEVLGLEVPDLRQGVLQDIHWAAGLFGYFPTYTLGTLAASQLYATAETELGLEAQVRAGDFGPLLGWLREKVHRQGALHSPEALLRRVTGGPLRTRPFLQHLSDLCSEVYGITTG